MPGYRVDQLDPSLRDPNFLERWGRVLKLREFFAREAAERGTTGTVRVLDLGSRGAPYRTLWKGGAVEWVAGDLREAEGVSVILDAHALPLGEGTVDMVLCTQVLEYVSDPTRCVAEMYRVLRKGGTAILSAPAVLPPWGEARWRIMPEGWKQLTAPFAESVVDAEVNTVASFFRVTNLYLSILLHSVPLVREAVGVTVIPLFNLIGRWAMPRFRDIGFACNYMVWARK